MIGSSREKNRGKPLTATPESSATAQPRRSQGVTLACHRHWQTPLTHRVKFGQTLPNAPRRFWSFPISRQIPLQRVSPVGQMQTPFWQVTGRSHSKPRAPRSKMSLAVSVHIPLQRTRPAGQAHARFLQRSPPGVKQTAPHLPRLPELVFVLTHLPLQMRFGFLHVFFWASTDAGSTPAAPAAQPLTNTARAVRRETRFPTCRDRRSKRLCYPSGPP